MSPFFRPLAAITSITMLTACATIVHPERKGNRGGSIDTVPLVVDILLFIPGLIPGVVALAVDFTTGAIYTGGGSAQAIEVDRYGKIAIRAGELPRDAEVELRLVDAEGRVLDLDRSGPGRRDRLVIDLATAAAAHPEPGPLALSLQMQVDDHPSASYPLVMK